MSPPALHMVCLCLLTYNWGRYCFLPHYSTNTTYRCACLLSGGGWMQSFMINLSWTLLSIRFLFSVTGFAKNINLWKFTVVSLKRTKVNFRASIFAFSCKKWFANVDHLLDYCVQRVNKKKLYCKKSTMTPPSQYPLPHPICLAFICWHTARAR